MPPFQTVGQNTPVKLVVVGVQSYLLGSRSIGPSFLMAITSVAVAANVVTIGVILRQGLLPNTQSDLVGQKIYVSGTSTDSGGANVQGGTITAVSIDKTTGVGTISYSKVAGNQSTTPDSGQATIPVFEIGETLANGTSMAVAVPNVSGPNNNAKTITWSTSFPGGAPGAVTVTLQAAEVYKDSEFQQIDQSTNTSGEIRQLPGSNINFLRAVVSGASGPTTIVVRVGV